MSHAIGKNVQALRKERGLSCGQLAELAKLSRAAVYAIEGGEYGGVQSRTIDRLAKAFGVEPAELMKKSRRS